MICGARFFWPAGIILIPLIIAAGVYAYRAIKKHFCLDNFGVVEKEMIYRSGQLLPSQLERLIAKHSIRTIIQTNAPELPPCKQARFRAVCDRHNVKTISILMPGDGRGEFPQYDEAIAILRDPANLPALVCCARGAHRTGAIIASYRVLVQGWPNGEALKEMEKYRFKPLRRRFKGKQHPLIPHLKSYWNSRLQGQGD